MILARTESKQPYICVVVVSSSSTGSPLRQGLDSSIFIIVLVLLVVL